MKGICSNCKKEKEVSSSGISKGLCHYCYKKLIWKPKKIICKRCGRELPMQAKGLCKGCYTSVFHINNIKAHNAKKEHNLDFDSYKQLTAKCVICGFEKIVELHHLDLNHKNNSRENLIGVCPNHHKMIHNRDYRKEVFDILRSKGFKVPDTYLEKESKAASQ